jgi:hypothetical protein
MKIGIIFTGYNMEEYIEKSISPWILAREQRLKNHQFFISAVSVPFLEYKELSNVEDNTIPFLREKHLNNQIDYLITEPKYIKEHLARNLALEPLLKQDVDIIWIADADEIPTIEQISNIISYIYCSNALSIRKF